MMKANIFKWIKLALPVACKHSLKMLLLLVIPRGFQLTFWPSFGKNTKEPKTVMWNHNTIVWFGNAQLNPYKQWQDRKCVSTSKTTASSIKNSAALLWINYSIPVKCKSSSHCSSSRAISAESKLEVLHRCDFKVSGLKDMQVRKLVLSQLCDICCIFCFDYKWRKK